MNLVRTLKRFLKLLIAYAVAVLVAGFGFATVGRLIGASSAVDTFFPFPVLDLFASVFIALLMALPSAIISAFAEWRGIRNILFYIAVAVLGGGALPAILGLESWTLWAGPIVGILSGLGFWLVAGRRAGELTAQGDSQKSLIILLIGAGVITAALQYFWSSLT